MIRNPNGKIALDSIWDRDDERAADGHKPGIHRCGKIAECYMSSRIT
jgi:hypothetical protein